MATEDVTNKVLYDRKALIFAELTSISKSLSNISTSRAQVYLRRVTSLDTDFRQLQREIIAFNASVKDVKMHVSVKDFNATTELINKIMEDCIELERVGAMTSSRTVQLPAIQLPIFTGQIPQWTEFITLYDSLVHKNVSLTKIEKFQYLRTFTRNEPQTIVNSYEFDEKNYQDAYKALVNRFSSSRRIASYHTQVLLRYRTSGHNVRDVITLLETHRAATSALLNLKTPNLAEYLLFELTYSNLEPYVQRSFDQSYDQTKLPGIEDILTHLESLSRTEELKLDFKSNSKVKPLGTPQKARTFITQAKEKKQFSCFHCNGEHIIYQCKQFKSLSLEDRLWSVKKASRCHNCLGDHLTDDCSSKSSCRVCSQKHHTLLHPPESVSNTCMTCTSSADKSCKVLMSTVRCHLRDSFGAYHTVRALLDNASDRCLVTLSLTQKLGLERRKEHRDIAGVGQSSLMSLGVTQLILRSRLDQQVNYICEASVVKQISHNVPTVTVNSSVRSQFQHLQLADPDFCDSAPVDLLLGVQVYADILSDDTHNIIKGRPSAVKTSFGWVVQGSTNEEASVQSSSTFHVRTVSLDQAITRFWETEEVEVHKQPLSAEDQLCEQHFVKTHKRDSSGRYVVRLPFKPEAVPESLDNRAAALTSFYNIEKRLNRDQAKSEAYKQFMKEYWDLGDMKLADKPAQYLLPHHCVTKIDSTSTKLRVVFNASYKDKHGKTLNSMLMAGPKVQADITSILLNFRTYNIAFSTDIQRMFRCIYVDEQDQDYQHVVWRSDTTSQVLEFKLCTVTYGMTSSSFLAQRTLLQLIKDEGHQYPEAAALLEQQTYMDDLLGGADTIEQARRIRQQLTQLLAAGGFPLRKWCSSHTEVIQDLPSNHKENPLFINSANAVIKVLGLFWSPTTDQFGFRVQPFQGTVTMRSFLSYIAGFYDPLGFLCPVVFRAKHMMQILWRRRLKWDEKLPQELQENWDSYVQAMPDVAQLVIPRLIKIHDCVIRLAGFADASESGYAAVVYTVTQDKMFNHQSTITMAKSRVAPLKPVFIHRLELMAAVLLAKLVDNVVKSTPNIKYQSIHLYSDSQTVLSWIRLPAHTLTTFVANRVVEINNLTSQYTWNYVTSQNNPADVASRGLSPHLLRAHPLWWAGPHFLQADLQDWPSGSPHIRTDVPEIKSTTLVVQVDEPEKNQLVTMMENFSSLGRLQRVMAWLLRFTWNVRHTQVKRSGPLSAQELSDALLVCIRLSQESDYGQDIKALVKGQPPSERIRRLSPFYDDNRLVRVGGRLHNSNLKYGMKHPLLLSKTSHLSQLMCQHFHKMLLHAGPRTTQSFIQRKYWIQCLHTLVRKIIHGCKQCHKLSGRPVQPMMAALPADRVQPSYPFATVGTDFAGPFLTKTNRRSSTRYKAYICVFVCFTTKAVHLEAVSQLTSEAFLAALDRFTAKRGTPAHIYSDNGRNYVGAARYLRECSSFLSDNKDQILSTLASRSIKWHFQPPSAPHFGGLYEAVVKSTKALLYRQVGDTVLTLEEFSTLLARVEAVLNSRPLGSVSTDPNDGWDYLSPGHFLVGRPLTAPAEEIAADDQHVTPRCRWNRVRQMAQQFWRRWSQEYLHTLVQRHKWVRGSSNIQVGQLVYISGATTTPLAWPLGRVTTVFPGSDGVVRVVQVKTSAGLFTRPVNKLVVCPV